LDEPRQLDALLRYLHRLDIPWPEVYDGLMWQTPLARLYGIHAVPAALVIGRDGIVHHLSGGDMDERLNQAIEHALATTQTSAMRKGYTESWSY